MRNNLLLTEALFAKAGESFAPVALPHTWNAFDGQDGVVDYEFGVDYSLGGDYHRGVCTYKIALPAPTPGKKQYIEFEGANHMATVWCNGVELGTHKGGFSTFRFELTDVLKDCGNELTVVVTNEVCDVYPQHADFTFFGGIYRPVHFIEAEPAHFDLMKDGTQGVFVTPRINGTTRLDVFPVNCEGCTVEVRLLDADGNVVGVDSAPAQEHTIFVEKVDAPHLWHGVEDPYCYQAEVSLCNGETVLDQVTVSYGYRSFHVDPDTGFWLNGKSMPLHGVSRHQDRKDKGWAISNEDHLEDITIIKEMGVNSIRLAHYQHSQVFYDLCDKMGFVLWAEIPFISEFMPGKEAYDNTISQMTELIAQNYNHPAICFWGISNEITIGESTEELYRNLCDLNALCKRLDPSRLTTMAQLNKVPVDSEHVYITDIQSYNVYFGWYSGVLSDNDEFMDRFHKENPDRCLGISEYGADNLLKWHSAEPLNHDYSEEYACKFHQHFLKAFAERPYIWSTYMWNMFDFAADKRNEGGDKGMNNKGLVTYDRKTRKDSFYVYQAYWTKEPMVRIAGRRFVDRAPGERDVTVYTNAESVTLFLNGEKYGDMKVEDHAAVFANVALNDGENTLKAVVDGAEDTIILCGVAESNPDYILPDIAASKLAGNWFNEQEDEESDEIQVVPGMYSVLDTLNPLLYNEECLRLTRGWIMSSKVLNPEVKIMATTNLPKWRIKFDYRVLPQMKVFKDLPQTEFARLNRMLSKVPKE